MSKPTIEDMVGWLREMMERAVTISPYLSPNEIMLAAIRDHLLAQQANTLPLAPDGFYWHYINTPLPGLCEKWEAALMSNDRKILISGCYGATMNDAANEALKHHAAAIARAKEGKS